MARALRAEAPALLLLVALGVAPFAGFGEGYILTLMARAMILAMAAVSLSLLVGGAGLVSMGHAAMMGFGAYAVVMLDALPGRPLQLWQACVRCDQTSCKPTSPTARRTGRARAR